MAEYAERDPDTQVASVFFPVAPDAIRMCGGACGNVKPSTAFPTVTGTSGARESECLACRDRRTGSTTDAASSNSGITVDRPAPDGRRKKLRIERQTVAATVPEVLMGHVGVAMTMSHVSEAIFDRVGFVPAVVDVRDTLRNLAMTDTRFVKLGRDAYAWVEEGAVPPPLPTPPHVVQMVERRRLGQTLDDIGTEFGVTRERVRQLIKKYGGPTAEDVRDLRVNEALTTQREEDLLQIARAYFADPEAPNSAHRFDEWKRKHAPDGPSAATLRNRFGSWNELKRRALAQEAGLDA